MPSVAFGLRYPCMFRALKASMLNRRSVFSVIGKTLNRERSIVQLIGPLRIVCEKGFDPIGPGE